MDELERSKPVSLDREEDDTFVLLGNVDWLVELPKSPIPLVVKLSCVLSPTVYEAWSLLTESIVVVT